MRIFQGEHRGKLSQGFPAKFSDIIPVGYPEGFPVDYNERRPVYLDTGEYFCYSDAVEVAARKGSYAMNMTETKMRRERDTGGVYYNEKTRKWIAQAKVTYEGFSASASKSFKTKAEAQAAKTQKNLKTAATRKATKRAAQAGLRNDKHKTLGEVVGLYLENRRTANSDKTYDNYVYIAELIAGMPINKMAVNAIYNNDIQRSVNGLCGSKARNIGESTVRKMLGQLKRIFKFAVSNGYCARNPMDSKIDIPHALKAKTSTAAKVKTSRENALSKETEALLLDVINASALVKPIILVMLDAGLRTEEALALSWDSVSLKTENNSDGNDTLTVDSAVIRKTVYDSGGKAKRHFYERQPVLKTPSAYRTIHLTERLKKALVDWNAIQTAGTTPDGMKLEKDKTGNNLVFPNRHGRLRTYDGLKGWWGKFLKAHGFPADFANFHVLRHTFCTRLADAEVPAHVLKYLAGHSQITTTFDYYISVNPEDIKASFPAISA